MTTTNPQAQVHTLQSNATHYRVDWTNPDSPRLIAADATDPDAVPLADAQHSINASQTWSDLNGDWW